MRLAPVLLVVCVLPMVASCSPFESVSFQPTPIPSLIPATLPLEAAALPPATPDTGTAPQPAAVQVSYPGQPLPTEAGTMFSGSGACGVCHTKMVDEGGNDVTSGDYWRSTMLANAARDPVWQATMRGETLANPEYDDAIQDKCTTCHMPMARFTSQTGGEKGKALDGGVLSPDNPLHALGMDAISCTLCHQIQADGFGEPRTFSGGYVIDKDTPQGERAVFGPYETSDALSAIMQGGSGFVPVLGPHVNDAGLCGTCHNLYTPTIDDKGEIVGEFPEQTLHLEWLNSDYRDTQSCQGCHMPLAEGGVQLSITGGELRQPFSKHVFVGGNAYMAGLIKTFGEEIGVTASSRQFDDTIERTLDQLQNRTAAVRVEQASLSDSTLTADIVIENQAGHKLPSGFPARRVWLHVTIRDAGGQVVFESGAVNTDGSIEGNDNDLDPLRYELHYQTIDKPDQVQIYEAVIHDAQNRVTTTLLRGAGYAKDNRLLPAGFDKETVPPDIAVYGSAASDQDFVGGSDAVRYAVDVSGATGPFTVEAELLIQSVSYRWMDNLSHYDAPEPVTFHAYYQAAPNTGTVLASDTRTVP